MQQYRLDIIDEKTLRIFGSDTIPLHTWPVSGEDVGAFAEGIEGAYSATSPDLNALGKRLYGWLERPSDNWLSNALRAGSGLSVHVDFDKRLRHLPWELLRSDGVFLCSTGAKPFTPVRRVHDVTQDPAKKTNRPLRVLFMACAPESDEATLDFEGEEARILEATQRQQIELVVEESGSLLGLEERIKWHGADYFDVFHLTGHANIVKGRPVFQMEDEFGGPALATADDIAEAFGGHWPRLIFLSGCKTGQAPDEGTLPSLCEAIVEAGARAVVGWALPVGDQDAGVAAGELFDHLTTGLRTDEAVAKARAKLFELKSNHWHNLRLYADATDLEPLVTPPGETGRERLHVRHAQEEFLDAGARMEVCAASDFVGRRRPIQRCVGMLRSVYGESSYYAGLLLTGMGGLGKSSLAARLCQRMPSHRRVVCVGEIDQGQILNVLSDKIENAGAIVNEPDQPLKHRLRRLLRMIEKDQKEQPILFVFDDFERNAEKNEDDSPRLDDQGRAVLTTESRDILRDFLEAVRDTASDNRVIVTCRYKFAPPSDKAELHIEPLEHFDGADLGKKLKQLPALKPDATTDETSREKATGLSGGNPRLLKRLDLVLANAVSDTPAILTALEEEAEEFREETLLRLLLDQQEDDCRALLALVSVCRLPVDRAAVEAIAGEHAVDPHLERAAALGLVEAGVDPTTRAPRYYVSDILHPLLADVIEENEAIEACRRAARHLFETWWDDDRRKLLLYLEIHRLATVSAEREIAVEIASAIASHWVTTSRFREAEGLCQLTLELGDEHRTLHRLGRAEEALGKTDEARRHCEEALALCPGAGADTPNEIVTERSIIIHDLAGLAARQGDVDRAMDLWNQSLQLDGQTGDARGKAHTLGEMAAYVAEHGSLDRAMNLWKQSLEVCEQFGDIQAKANVLTNMAAVIAQEGDMDGALNLLKQSLELRERLIGDAPGKARTLHQMAGVIAKQGDVDRAMELWKQSLELTEHTGFALGSAATLAQMAWALGKQGDHTRQRQLYTEAGKGLASIRAWPNLVTVLGNLSTSDDADAGQFLGQAVWLILRIQVPIEQSIKRAAELQQKIGDDAEAAPLIATFANYLVQTRGKDHPKQEELQKYVVQMLGACAVARKVPEDKFGEWFKAEKLDDPEYFIAALSQALEAMVPDDAWLFDRSAVAEQT